MVSLVSNQSQMVGSRKTIQVQTAQRSDSVQVKLGVGKRATYVNVKVKGPTSVAQGQKLLPDVQLGLQFLDILRT